MPQTLLLGPYFCILNPVIEYINSAVKILCSHSNFLFEIASMTDISISIHHYLMVG